MTERAEWTAGIRGRDPATLEAVVHHCPPGRLRAARASGLVEDRAEDTVQSAVLVFVRRAEEFDGRAQASTWLQGILARTIQDQRRLISNDDEREDIDDDMESRFDTKGSWIRPPRGPADDLVLGELNEALNACLERLPDRQRQAFALREVEGSIPKRRVRSWQCPPITLECFCFAPAIVCGSVWRKRGWRAAVNACWHQFDVWRAETRAVGDARSWRHFGQRHVGE